MENVKKFSDLEVGSTYSVYGYSDPRNSKFGIGINYILKISKENSNEVFEIFSTNLLAEYIYTVKLDKLFKFTVHERNNTKYPVIEGFKKERKFTMLN